MASPESPKLKQSFRSWFLAAPDDDNNDLDLPWGWLSWRCNDDQVIHRPTYLSDVLHKMRALARNDLEFPNFESACDYREYFVTAFNDPETAREYSISRPQFDRIDTALKELDKRYKYDPGLRDSWKSLQARSYECAAGMTRSFQSWAAERYKKNKWNPEADWRLQILCELAVNDRRFPDSNNWHDYILYFRKALAPEIAKHANLNDSSVGYAAGRLFDAYQNECKQPSPDDETRSAKPNRASPKKPEGALSTTLNCSLWTGSAIIGFCFLPFIDVFSGYGARFQPPDLAKPLIFGGLATIAIRWLFGRLCGERFFRLY